MGKKIDLTGKIFSRLLVIEEADAKYRVVKGVQIRERMWVCLCTCGVQVVLSGNKLATGNTKSCGCLKREILICRNTKHGHKVRRGQSRTYKIWRSMIDRCTLESSKDYPSWGGRGIAVCDWWRDFRNFLADMGEAPIGLSIDRRDNNGNYNKQNCRWATPREQQNNRRSNHLLEYGGEILTITQWAERTGISKATLLYRVRAGWSVANVLTKDVNYSNCKLYKGD